MIDHDSDYMNEALALARQGESLAEPESLGGLRDRDAAMRWWAAASTRTKA